MLKVLTAAQMREVDRLTTERYGIPSILLMENAAHAVARVITEKLGGSVKGKRILILCGPGNNGGDGAALARILWEQEADCFALLLGRVDATRGDARVNFEIEILRRISDSSDANSVTTNCLYLNESDEEASVIDELNSGRATDCVVDALFGTGLTRPLAGNFLKAVEDLTFRHRHLKQMLVVSVDLPSGMDADRNVLIGEAVCPDTTVT
ncbi:MAG: NAD(P)H-hydrate epimerase, partial [Acidobacteria bacterium]|nr:NAD(P)H-hydrate epimerase [Acidobacteriota bacterium]